MSIALIPILVNDVYGHGLGGDVAPPIDFDGQPVTVSTQLDPYDITVGEVDSANMAVRFYNSETDENFNSVTYLIEIWRANTLLARNNFYDDDGLLNVEIKPIFDCTKIKLSECTKYAGSEHISSPGALYAYGNGRVAITGPIFDKGGLYNIQVEIIGATSPKTIVAKPLQYDTFVSVAQEQPFFIQTASAEVPVTVKTYYDEVGNFGFNPSDNSTIFDMPFDWSTDYIEYVALVHEELQFPKTFEPYSETSFTGYVDGVEIKKEALSFDPFTYEDKNIVHFLITGQELERINDILGPEHTKSKTMQFKLVPQDAAAKSTNEFYLVDPKTSQRVGTDVIVSWDDKYGAGDNVPFEITFLDENQRLLKDVKFSYALFDSDNNLLLRAGDDPNAPDGLGISSLEGIAYENIMLPLAGEYRLDILVLGTGLNYDPTYAGIGSTTIKIGSESSISAPPPAKSPAIVSPPAKSPIAAPMTSIPEWVKTNAAWWAEGNIDDATFATGIEFLIKDGLISVPDTERQEGGDTVIPDWVRNNADWWAQGLISDEDFAGGLQYMIANGMIVV